jgi:hypothetical protein
MWRKGKKMNLYQCQEAAKKVGFDSARFVATFPCGPVKCQWLDAYFGMFKADVDGLRDGFLMVKEIQKEFPDIECSEPYVGDA